MNLDGTFVALVTPFRDDGQLNEEKIRELVRFQLENGTDGIVPCGTTGESPTLSDDEKYKIFELVISEAGGKATIIAGAGTNNTQKTIQATRKAKELGADAALIITPYYNKPTQHALIRHFEAVAEVGLPIMIYNVPGRTCVNMLPETVEKLAALDEIVAIKEASGDLNQISAIVNRCGDKIKVLSGDDSLFTPILSVGGCGVVSVIANILPADLKAIYTAFRENRMDRVQELHYQLFEICNAMFYETNPVPVKTAMNLLGKDVGDFRLPLAPMIESNLARLKAALRNYSLLQ